MPIEADIKREKAEIRMFISRNKLGKMITQEILNPILDNIKAAYPKLLLDAGEKLINLLIHNLEATAPSGHTYHIYEYDFRAPSGEKERYIDSYTASSPGGAPTGTPQDTVPTGSLIASLGFELMPDGRLKYGQLVAKTGFEFESTFFRAGKIFISDENKSGKAVEDYGKILERDRDRQWFNKPLRKYRPIVMKKLREDLREVVRKSTRRYSVRRAIYFKIFITR